ncbi:putative tRNA-specific adenosine-34 deaminase subunit Tad3 [Aspergillus undulatus]|uniref:putative tRNA-specific adenosine-34 deaminase subunit Tad3 n=1 Tax=Aspergillus undulatus TaxID=1810928 RepID=UPI003CCDEB55
MDAQEIHEIIRDIEPLIGEVKPIKTVQETQPAEEYDDAYVVGVNVKSAAKVVKALDAAFPRDPARPMNHLRRFAKQENLPKAVQSIVLQDNPSPETIFLVISPPLPPVDRLQELLGPYAPPPEIIEAQSSDSDSAGQIKLYTIKVPTLPPLGTAQVQKWSRELWPVVYNPAAARLTVSPPVQVLNRARDFIQPIAGRYLAFSRKVAEEAEQSGRGRGVGAVVVDPDIVSRIIDAGDDIDSKWADAIVAVAGDARYSRREAGAPSVAEQHSGPGPNPAAEAYNADLEGGPDLHALMRAAEIVAYKRRAGDPAAENDKPSLSLLESYFLSQSDLTTSEPEPESESQDITPVPEKYQKTGPDGSQAASSAKSHTPGARIRPRSQGGYLCTDLDVYLTHEPCVCCCMGLLLSRFRSVIYPQRGRMIMGGLASEPVITPIPSSDSGETITKNQDENGEDEIAQGQVKQPTKENRPYYGLHWRKELNWRALGFEFVEDEEWSTSQDFTLAEDGIAFYA